MLLAATNPAPLRLVRQRLPSMHPLATFSSFASLVRHEVTTRFGLQRRLLQFSISIVEVAGLVG